jgi:hypothetical protein
MKNGPTTLFSYKEKLYRSGAVAKCTEPNTETRNRPCPCNVLFFERVLRTKQRRGQDDELTMSIRRRSNGSAAVGKDDHVAFDLPTDAGTNTRTSHAVTLPFGMLSPSLPPDRSAVARSEGKAGVGVVHASATGTGPAAVVYPPRLALQRQARAEPHGPRGQPRRGSESDRRARSPARWHAARTFHPAARPLAAWNRIS